MAKGGKIPIILLTCNRAKLLKQTLGSLFAVRGVSKEQVLVIQDGRDQAVEQVVKQAGLRLVQVSLSLSLGFKGLSISLYCWHLV